MENPTEGRISTEARGHVFLMGIDRTRKMNAFDLPMLKLPDGGVYGIREQRRVSLRGDVCPRRSFQRRHRSDPVHPRHFIPPPGMIDPMGIYGPMRSKPLVTALHGRCLTIAIELALASDICVAADNARFGQIEVKRGVFPAAGATIRLVPLAGWGNAMRYLLTGDEFDAHEAFRIGLVQEVAPLGQQLDAAVAIAERIAAQAPLAVRATLLSARKAIAEGPAAAFNDLLPQFEKLQKSEDAKEGLNSFVERRTARFTGR